MEGLNQVGRESPLENLSRREFEVLSRLLLKRSSQRTVANELNLSVGSVHKAICSLRDKGYLNKESDVTSLGISALQPYKVDNAVILAAGMATRFAPLSFEKPRAMFNVRGEILIERLIRQLHESGIKDVSVVVGYMKESFFYLEDKFGVRIIVSPEYATRNNHSSLWMARKHLGNTYVLAADQYFSENVFEPYVYEAFCGGVFVEGSTSELTLACDKRGYVVRVDAGGKDSYRMQGPAYFDRRFSSRYLSILEEEYDKPITEGKLWNTIYAEHVSELPMRMKEYSSEVIHEFDYVSDLCAFDVDFFANVDSRILDNICSTLKCERLDISRVEPVSAGLTNLSVRFSCKGETYIYRHPGNGTDEIINREAEAYSLGVAKELGLDGTFVCEDAEAGWKISRFVPDCVEFDYKNELHVSKALQMARRLHESGASSPWSFDFYEEACKIVGMLERAAYPLPQDFEALSRIVDSVAQFVSTEAGSKVLCHNDLYGPNFLINDEVFYLIDWEYSAMGDYGCDIGNFISQGSGYSVDEAIGALDKYFGRPPTDGEVRHCLACTAIVGFYWYVWAVYKESQGNPVGEWLYVWYKAAKTFGNYVLPLYEKETK